MSKPTDTIQQLINTAIQFIVNYGFQVLGALIILAIGFMLANWAAGLLAVFFEKKKVDITLSRFITGIARLLILGFALLIALGKFGITITPFIAALSALTFGASFALQGPLSNYAAGLSIILSRPFVVGNTISVAGVSGLVAEVKLACTILSNEDGVRITIPNKDIVGEILHNSQGAKIVEAVIGISYADDPEKAIRVIGETLASFSDVAKEPRAQVGIQAFADFSVNIGYRYWAPTAKYFQVSYAVNLAIYKAIQAAGISIPFPQREVRFLNQPAENKV